MTGNAGRHLLLVHAHPDDESIGQGATMARYVAEGVGVTLVTCTGGEMGEILVPELEHLADEWAAVVTERSGRCEFVLNADDPLVADLGRDRDEQRPERFQVGQKFDAMVTGLDRSKKPNFSIKALQIAEEKQAVAQYGSSDSGASLGDILGAALKEKQAASEKKAKK